MTVVNTHCGLCLFGVRMRRAMQMQIDAMTICCQTALNNESFVDVLLIGANHKIMR